MNLNDYRDEAAIFLQKIGAENEGIEPKLKMLAKEFDLLKKSIADPDALRHQIYDLLFILFEISADYNFDLQTEWNKGRKKKKKYL